MGYREQRLSDRSTITIDGTNYDIDGFGMDDGRSEAPDAAFRFLFQLGHGWMIHLYVIQAGGNAVGHRHFHHSFWLKDCAVAHVEIEEYGPPGQVALAGWCALPLIYTTVTIEAPEQACGFAIEGQRVRGAEIAALEMELALTGGGYLRWTRARAWELEVPGAPARALRDDERLRFAPAGDA